MRKTWPASIRLDAATKRFLGIFVGSILTGGNLRRWDRTKSLIAPGGLHRLRVETNQKGVEIQTGANYLAAGETDFSRILGSASLLNAGILLKQNVKVGKRIAKVRVIVVDETSKSVGTLTFPLDSKE
jgi:hypothetical protein